ncbi:MAG: hypothetical protein ACREK1_01250 [Longimicrobiales bacterium]
MSTHGLAWGLLGLLGLLAGCTAAGADGPGAGEEYRPPDELVRLQSLPVDRDDIGLVRDFDIAGDTVYLLDSTGRVVVLRQEPSGMHFVHAFGRRGSGPGEFMRPTGIAMAGHDIVVADGTRLQFFSRSGEFLAAKWLNLPCPMMLPSVAPSRIGVFVHGNCMRSGYVTDTMKAVLAWSADTAGWEVILETPRFTLDGSLGSIFGASRLLTTGPDGRHAFGGGEANCIWNIDDRGGRPAATEICPAAAVLYSADAPPGLEKQMRSARFAGKNLRWPASLPAYRDRFISGDHTVLLRPFSIDSVVLQLVAPLSTDLAIAPHEGLLGCKPAGCLWLLDDSDPPHLIVLDRTRIEALLRQGSRE